MVEQTRLTVTIYVQWPTRFISLNGATVEQSLRKDMELKFCTRVSGLQGVKGSWPGHFRGHSVSPGQHRWPSGEGFSYSPGVIDATYSLSTLKTVCAWRRAISYKRWPCCAEHSGSRGVNHEKKSPILQCECRAYGMNGSRWVCLEQHPLGYQVTSQG